MSSRLIATVIDTGDVERAVEFWCAVLDAQVQRRWRDAYGVEYVEVGPAGGAPVLLFQPVAAATGRVNTLHLDVAPGDCTQDAEVRRLIGLGATPVADDPAQPWVVLADPDGNPFCVLPPR